jgi:23S rRNA U2552 (ribose-2'-O)-methylase RlmE/FtsJ
MINKYYKEFNEVKIDLPKNDLEKYFFKSENKKNIHKWFHYFEIYDTYFSKYRGVEVNILEIGVESGGSLQMWKDYFGPKAKIYGIDINPNCKKYEEDQIEIYIGSQEDKNFWSEMKQKLPKLDIIIDDGGHTMLQQIVTYEEMFDHLKDDGVYLCEDLHTSYLGEWGGGYKNPNTFIEYSKNFIDYLHYWYISNVDLKYETKNIFGLHFYDSILVIEKRKINEPFHCDNGVLTEKR